MVKFPEPVGAAMLGQAIAPEGQAKLVVLTDQLLVVLLTVNPVGKVTLATASVPLLASLAQTVPVVAWAWAKRSKRTRVLVNVPAEAFGTKNNTKAWADKTNRKVIKTKRGLNFEDRFLRYKYLIIYSFCLYFVFANVANSNSL